MNTSRSSHPLRNIGLLLALLTCLCLFQAPAQASRPAANIAPVSSGDDFATQVLHHPWTMDSADDIDFWHTSALGNLSNVSVSGGTLSATATTADPRVLIRVPTPGGAAVSPYEGSYRPISPAAYRYGTVRMFFDKNTFAQFFWQPRGGGYSSSKFADIKAGWNIVTIDLNQEGTGRTGASWSSVATADGFYFDPAVATGSLKIDFIRLSQGLVNVPITWDAGGLSGNVNIYVGPNDAEKALIATVPASSGQYTWPTSLAPGSYQVFVQQSGNNVGGSPFSLPVNGTPQLQITAPSYISGPDYASSVVGDPWDMSNPEDATTRNVINQSFSNGILSGASVNGNDDPGVNLHVTAPIDTARYKYATYRLQVDSDPNPLNAGVARLLWWVSRPENAGVTNDIVAYQGMRTYSFDLTKIELEPEQNGPAWLQTAPTAFRLDPHEYSTSHGFHIDYVMLTGNDQASDAFNIRFNRSDPDGSAPSIQFFYDSDNQGANGTAIGCSASPAPGAVQNPVYIPIITKGKTPPVQPTGESCRWDVASVPNGAYYIYGVASDGVDSSVIYSDTPVEVRH